MANHSTTNLLVVTDLLTSEIMLMQVHNDEPGFEFIFASL